MKTLARWLVQLEYADLPQMVVDYTKRFLLDDVGCMLGGAIQLGNKGLVRAVLALGETGRSTVAVYGTQTSAPSAALVNGAFIAGWDYDASSLGGVHLGSQTAALLAMAEDERVDGKALLTAECAGIEAQSRIGIATGGVAEDKSRDPWHSNTVLGPFAAAVTTGKLLDFDAEAMEHALGLVTQQLGGNYQHYFTWGSSMKRVRCGLGAWTGVRAALLVQAGLTGPPLPLDGRHGYFEALHGKSADGTPYYDAGLMTAELGERWYTLTYRTKGFGAPCVTGLQTPCVTAIALTKQYNFRNDDIKAVTVEHSDELGLLLSDHILGTVLGRTPEQRLGSAGWSRRWMVALCLVLGAGGIREQLNHIKPYGRYREIEALSKKIDGRVNKAYYTEHFKEKPYPNTFGGRIIVELKDGRILEHEPLPYLGGRMSDGTVNTPTYAQLQDKFREQATPAGIPTTKQERAIAIITHLEDQENVDPLISNLIR
jgi:2-methylcitrate dehydratase PrpD